ncbi:glucose-1-phosphate adenylyltransferase subunit GlgD [Murdochiella vaginalis]|uniref:glucose-1-phosphate adenylyltransferase subunit GlgD n=1 Tax=Murdochiella vaginalis TaxID=1852373 RepID=UPI0008FDAC73|nr:glucose-1-phosphate adenylyltransferase subunit GlgD [Murdochiella vaginalis]
MKDCLGIIYSRYDGTHGYRDFGRLSENRPDYMIPFGGRYRIIDFALSSLSNYSLSRVILYGGNNIRSTLDHVGDGKNWELNRRNNGLFINPPSRNWDQHPSIIQTYYDSITFFEESTASNIHVMNPMMITKADLDEAYDRFLESGDDVLLFYKNIEDRGGVYTNMSKLILDDQGNFVNMGINLGTNEAFPLYLERMFIKRTVFVELVKRSLERGSATTLVEAVDKERKRLKIGVYEVSAPVLVINDIYSYFQASMSLLDQDLYQEIFFRDNMVYTKSKDEPSTMYASSANVRNSLVANGCIVEGQVENSILSRGVHVHKDAIVRNSILNEKTVVGPNAVVVNTITDKQAVIEEGVTLAGAYSHPFVVGKKEVISR